jgi:transposase-like protein
MVKCPHCNSGVKSKPSKNWSYGYKKVEHYTCENCRKGFNLYITKSNKYTIPKAK